MPLLPPPARQGVRPVHGLRELQDGREELVAVEAKEEHMPRTYVKRNVNWHDPDARRLYDKLAQRRWRAANRPNKTAQKRGGGGE